MVSFQRHKNLIIHLENRMGYWLDKAHHARSSRSYCLYLSRATRFQVRVEMLRTKCDEMIEIIDEKE